ncbi:MAG: hypothetical protein RIS47_2237 [Bacteroidota bacterium]|jgi:DNA-binding MarR family transcriptional regulator
MKPQETVDFHIKSTWHALSRMYNQIAADYGMSLSIGYVLINVMPEGTPATKIAPLMGMEPTSLSRLLKTMEDTNLIYREKDAIDKRVVRIHLTNEGILKKKVAKMVIKKFNEEIYDRIPMEDMVVFFRVIEAINAFSTDYIPPQHRTATEMLGSQDF